MNTTFHTRYSLHRIGVLGLLLVALFLSACSQERLAIQDEAFIHSEAELETVGETLESDQLGVIASLELENGNVVRFIDEQLAGDGYRIGVVEVTQPGFQSVISQLVAGQHLSPLELYLSLAPDKAAPPELTAHHRMLADAREEIPLEPRRLTRPALSTQAVGVSACTGLASDTHWDFLDWVVDGFGAALPHHGHGHNLTSTHYGVTGASSKRALGTCNAKGYVKSVRIEYQFGQNLWISVPLGGTWLFPGTSLFYYSDSGFLAPQKYRIRVGFTVQGLEGNTAHTEGSW